MKSPNIFLRRILPLIVVLLTALLLGNALHPYWVGAFLDKRSFISDWGWFSPSWLALTWGYDLLLAFVASIVLGLVLPRDRRSAWIIGLGVAIAALHVLTERNYTSPAADFTMHGWIYGGYLMPAVGAALGAIVVHRFHRIRTRNRAPTA